MSGAGESGLSLGVGSSGRLDDASHFLARRDDDGVHLELIGKIHKTDGSGRHVGSTARGAVPADL